MREKKPGSTVQEGPPKLHKVPGQRRGFELPEFGRPVSCYNPWAQKWGGGYQVVNKINNKG